MKTHIQISTETQKKLAILKIMRDKPTYDALLVELVELAQKQEEAE